MMKLEELSDQNMIVKGKRTKRPRPSSSTSSNGGELCNAFVSSPATSSGISTSTEEDEDMANCLILLARGNSPPQPDEIKTAPENKFSSRKFAEMATTAAGKVGIYVYECKTCNRTFPSFQALGGHRASHKKPKTAAEADQRKSPPSPENQEVEGGKELRKSTTISPPPPAQNDPNKSKMHECSICGSEFGSGQALGGHMRRHRSVAPPSASGRIPTSVDAHTTSHEKARNLLALDLNLPAPPEDEKLQPPPPHVVFSTAALVDCHY
ncbi:zinc finger protein ZAT5-like [Salvia divinorum]|uniref:Zinc finger protein ZAT5-like n=1 Tax=Salvia divinorum TaxID=28513 RepID=A0ABD1HNZ6_SALDI